MSHPVDTPRIDGLRRRVQQDPASIAFAQLGEELRRAGQIDEAIEICRAGLVIHPTYLSARVTLGRALIESGDLDAAQREMEQVLAAAADNLAAIRALGDIHHRRGALDASLARYRTALELAPNDPDLEEIVATLTRELAERAASVDVAAPATAEAAAPAPDPIEETGSAVSTSGSDGDVGDALEPFDLPSFTPPAFDTTAFSATTVDAPANTTPAFASDVNTPEFKGAPFEPSVVDPERFKAFAAVDSALAVSFVSEPADAEQDRLVRTVAALEGWLDAINVARTGQRA